MDGGSGQRGRRSSEAAAVGEVDPTDGGLGLHRCSLKDAPAGEEGLLTKGCSTERKAAAGQDGLTKGRSTERKAGAVGVLGEEAPAARARMARLSKMEVLRCLSRDPSSIAPYNVDSLRRLVEEEEELRDVPEAVLRAVADSFNEGMRNKFVAFQDWVLAELNEKGYVEVPEQFVKEREETEKRLLGPVDLYLPDSYFTTVSGKEGGGKEKLVFSFTGKEKVVPESKSNKENILLSYTAELEPELEAIFS